MKKEEQLNFEILSKIVIGLKTSQNESIKKINEEIENFKNEGTKNIMDIREKYDMEIFVLKNELNDMKLILAKKETDNSLEMNEMKSKYEKTIMDVREDMLKLLKKYETRFETQDEEIDILKKKCEMADCKICQFQSFKVNFFICTMCNYCICSECMQVCKNCGVTKCIECLIKCGH
jgi:hypothetical protein